MVEPCTWATAHLLRFDEIETPDTLDLAGFPAGAASWNFGPDGAVGPDGNRLPSSLWCGVGLYRDRESAERAIDNPQAFLPFLDRAVEAWHAVLLPIAHRGECNHLDRKAPGLIFRPAAADPGGPLITITTVGFILEPVPDIERIRAFRFEVEKVRTAFASFDGNLAQQVFTPHVIGNDACTISVWRDEAAIQAFAYQPGLHRTAMDRYKAEHTADRSSFSRLRAVRSKGQWGGCNPAEA